VRKRKILISLVIAGVLSLTVASAAYAATGTKAQGYRGGSNATQAAQTQARGRAQDGSGTNTSATCNGTCDGTGPQGTAAQVRTQNTAGTQNGNPSGNVGRRAAAADQNGVGLQQRARACDGTCDQSQAGSQDQQRLRDGSCGRPTR
jgi:hypothetical protein